jgi:hypothetical protein
MNRHSERGGIGDFCGHGFESGAWAWSMRARRRRSNPLDSTLGLLGFPRGLSISVSKRRSLSGTHRLAKSALHHRQTNYSLRALKDHFQPPTQKRSGIDHAEKWNPGSLQSSAWNGDLISLPGYSQASRRRSLLLPSADTEVVFPDRHNCSDDRYGEGNWTHVRPSTFATPMSGPSAAWQSMTNLNMEEVCIS